MNTVELLGMTTTELVAALPLFAVPVSVFLLIMGRLNRDRVMEAVASVCLIVSLVFLVLGPHVSGIWP